MDMPDFPYHPDPIKTETFVSSSDTCECCGWATGLIYRGPIRFKSRKQPVSKLCPTCIEDGSAAEKFDVTFCDEIIGDDVPPQVAKQIMQRTPGFPSWRTTKWIAHCHDAAAFVGPYGWRGLRELDNLQLVTSLRENHDDDFDDHEWERVSSSLHRDRGGATAMVFKCRHCEQLLGYVDEL